MADDRIGLHPEARPGRGKERKRISGARARATGRPPAAATRAQASRSGARRKVNFEGGQIIHMRMRKLRGLHMKKSMPFEKFRTQTQPVNLRDLEARFDKGAEVTLDLCARRTSPRAARCPKIPGKGDISKALTVHAHGFSKPAREKIEAAAAPAS